MKESLLCRPAAIGPKDYLPGEPLGAGERMDVDEDRIVYAVELPCFSLRCIDHARLAENLRGMTADPVKTIEGPAFRSIRGRPLRRRSLKLREMNTRDTVHVAAHSVLVLRGGRDVFERTALVSERLEIQSRVEVGIELRLGLLAAGS